MPFLIPIAGIAGWAYVRTHGSNGSVDLAPLHDDLDEAQSERDALLRRVEALEAIVTSEGFELEREARRAGIAPALDLDALPDPSPEPRAQRRRTRS